VLYPIAMFPVLSTATLAIQREPDESGAHVDCCSGPEATLPPVTLSWYQRGAANPELPGFATVCVNPVWVQTASRLLQHTGVGVCAVVGFPLGATTADVKAYETRRVVFDGAREVDMVINVGALKSGDLKTVERDIEAVADTCREGGALSKVIIEAALLTDEEKVTACTLAKAAGADYVKTSTGFARSGATVADVQLMRRVVGPEMGVKAAGGVRDLEQVKAMAAAGASRIGASAGVKIVRESRGEKVATPGSGY